MGGACEIKDKTGKKVDKKEVDAKNKLRQDKAAKLKKEWEAKEKAAKASGKTFAKLACPKGKDDTGALVECSGFGICTMGKKSGKPRCACDYGFTGFACQMDEAEKEEMKNAQKNAIEKMKGDFKKGKIQNHKQQKDFLKSILADNDDEADMDPEVADSLVESQKAYAEELRAKFKRKKQGKASTTDADFEAPTKEEINEMMEQTLKLRKQRKAAKQAKEDAEEFDRNDTNATNVTKKAGELTKAERDAKRAKKVAARKAQKEEMAMMRDLQAVQGTALLDEMKKGGKKTAGNEQSYGDTYMKTTVLDSSAVGEQMYSDASGNKKMQIGKGAKASQKGEDAVATNKTRLLQDANATKAGNATASGAWKQLKGEDDYMRVILDKKMFSEGPLKNVSKPVITFNRHSPDYVKDFPRGKKGSYDAKTGKKPVLTAEQKKAKADAKAAAEKKAGNGTYVDEDDSELEDTVAQQVMELEFIDGDTMEKLKIANLTKGMLKICMMMKNDKQKISYMNEDNDQMQDDGITKDTMKQRSTRDDTNQKERKGYEMCVDLTHATTFATVDGESSSSLYSYSMMVLVALLAVLFRH